MFPSEAVPERIGSYRVLKYIGLAGSADVYVARMEGPMGFARDVVLKMVRSDDHDARFADELAREAAICARLNHPTIVRMHDFFEYEGRIVLVLEQVDGASVDRLMSHLARRKQTLSDGAILYLAAQLAAGIAHAHASSDEDGNLSPVIHRDLKPENVIIGWDGQVRLAGFGLGKILGRTPDSIAGTVRGTPGWMSPEQARGERATVRSDVYGFGMLLWSLFASEDPPLDGAKPKPLSEIRPDLPRELLAAIDAALEPSPDRRKIGCAELSAWLGKLVKPEAGREELRKKVLWLRSTRGPASKLDPTPQARQTSQKLKPRRRQSLDAMRAVTSVRRPSAFPSSPPSSRRPSSRSPAAPSSVRPESVTTRPGAMQSTRPPVSSPPTGVMVRGTGRPPQSRNPPSNSPRGEHTSPLGFRIPPPPPLPGASNELIHTPVFGPAPVQQQETGNPPTLRPPGSMRPMVRTVSTAPSARPQGSVRPQGSTRPGVVAYEDVPRGAQLEPWESTQLAASFDGPHPNDRPTTHRPATPQSFTLVNQLLLAGLTAGFVVALGLLFLRTTDRQQLVQQPQQLAPAQTQQAPAATVAPAPPTPATQAAATARQPAPTDPPAALASPATDRPKSDGMPDPSMLDNTTGYLMVKGPTNADVYLNGVRRGASGEPMLVPCGRFYMRMAPPTTARYPEWITAGQTVFIACRSSTVLTVEATGVKEGVAPAPLSVRRGGGMGL